MKIVNKIQYFFLLFQRYIIFFDYILGYELNYDDTEIYICTEFQFTKEN